MCAGIVDDDLVGLHVLPHQLSGNRYRDFLLHDLSKLLENVPLAIRARMWYMHDGTPAHISRAVRDIFSNAHRDQWLRRVGLTAWFPCSRDFYPLHFYLWGHLEIRVYAAPVDSEKTPHRRLVDVCQTIRKFSGVFERMQRSMMRRAEV
jgi:hypothetical protein